MYDGSVQDLAKELEVLSVRIDLLVKRIVKLEDKK